MATIHSDDDGISKLADNLTGKAVTAVAGNWFERADENQRVALGVVAAAAVLGPLGQGLLAASQALYSTELPSSEQLKAVWWLAVLTLPVFAAAVTIVSLLGKGHIMALMGLAALASLGGSIIMGATVPKQLEEVYCYNDGQVLENECREFQTEEFLAEWYTADGSSERLSVAFAYTADARGLLMAMCGVAAGAGGGYILRRELERS